MVLGRGLLLVGAGVSAGLLAALVCTRVLAALLYDVRPTDPAVLAAIVALLAVVGGLAAYAPARRATRTDPMIALRSE
jgi:ABC-type antimicrobial peptide transport system permease subunit